MKLHLPLSLRAALLVSAAFFSNQNLYAEVALTDNPTIWTEESAPGYTSDDWFSASGIDWEIRSGSYATTGGTGSTPTSEWEGLLHTSFQLNNEATLTIGKQASVNTTLSLTPETQYNIYDYVELMGLTQDSSLVNHGTLSLEASLSASYLSYSGMGAGTIYNDGKLDVILNGESMMDESIHGSGHAAGYGLMGDIDNDGLININSSVNADFYGYCHGIYGSSQTIDNNGTLMITTKVQSGASSSASAFAIIQAYGIELTHSSDITNDGKMVVSVEAQNHNPNSSDFTPTETAQGINLDGSLTNNNSLQVSVKGSGTNAIVYGAATSTLINNGEATIEAQASSVGYFCLLESQQGGAFGLVGPGYQSWAVGMQNTNKMSIKTTAYGSPVSRGASCAVISNSGTLAIDSRNTTDVIPVDVSLGYSDESLIAFSDGIFANRLSNSGTISITTSTKSNGSAYEGYTPQAIIRSCGIVLNPYQNTTDEAILQNTGTITVNTSTTASISDYLNYAATAEGILLCSSQLHNSGTIKTCASISDTSTYEGGSSSAYGLYLDSSNATNSVTGSITAQAVGSSNCTLVGIALGNGSCLYNAGTLVTDSLALLDSQSRLYLLSGATEAEVTEGVSQHFSGAGTVYLGGELAEDGSVTALASGSSLTANSGLSFSGVTVDVVDELTLHMGGDLTFAEDVSLNRNGHNLIIDNGDDSHQVTLGDDFCAEWDGAVRMEAEDDLLKLTSEGGNTLANGTLTAKSISLEAVQDTTFTVKDTALNLQGGSLSLTNVIVKGSSSFTSTASTYTASLNNTTFVLDGAKSSHLLTAPTLSGTMSNLVATTVTSAYYISYDMLAGCSVSGSLTLDFSYWASEISSGGYDGIVLTLGEGMVFTMNADSVFGSLDGENKGIAEAVSGNSVLFLVSNLPSNNRVVESDGIVNTPLSDKHVVELSPSGRVDVSTLPDLPQDYISGTGGELITSPSQRLELRGQEDVGYDIIGHQPGGFGADLQIGKPHGTLGDADITLNGHRYNSKLIDVLSGKLTINGHAVLGMAGSVTTIGSGSAPGSGTHRAEVLNHGTMRGDVLVEQDGMLRNNGHIEGALTIHQGGRLHGSGHFHGHTHIHGGAYHYVGNSPGYQEFTNGLTYGNGANLTFCVDGATAASAANAGAGTHSFLKVSGGALTLEGNVNTTVEVTSGIRTMGAMPFSLTLMQVDLSNAATTNTGGNSQPFSLTLSDTENLAPNASVTLTWDATTGTLALSGTWDKYATAALLAGDGSTIANTLWSSTSAVQAFARNATSQLSSPVVSKNGVTVWGSALGDYVSMSGFRSSAQGYAVGADRQWCPHIRGGIAFGQMFGDFTADRGVTEVEQESMMVGLYSEYLRKLNKRSSLSVTGYAAYGQMENDADTMVGGSSQLPGHASWDDKVFALGARAQWNIHLTEKTTLSPFIGLEYLRGNQEDFTETFSGGSREYRDGSMQVWSMPVGMTVRTQVPLGRTQKLLPELTVAYVGDIARKEPHVRSRVYGVDNCHEGTKPGRSGFMLNVGTNWLISEDWSAGAFYNVETRSHEVSQEFNAAVRYSF